MKKLGILIGLSSILALTSCSNSTTETSPEDATMESHSTTTTTTTTKTNDDGTIINVDKDGFEIGKKDGSTETKVKVSTDSVRIKLK
jgi:ABC-type glycerol-3-phosphate transport system substrate-binding protein